MNKERLAELRALAAAATPGPWTTSSAWSVRSGRDELVAATSYYNHEADADFIASARDAIPELLDEVERLLAERDALRAAFREFVAQYDAALASADECVESYRADRRYTLRGFKATIAHHAAILRTLNKENER